MRQCPACGADYNVLDAICPRCGKELPAPYEGWGSTPPPEKPEEAADAGELSATLLEDTVPSEQLILTGAEVMLGDASFNPGTVVVTRGKIAEVLSFPLTENETDAIFVKLDGLILAAGFVNLSPVPVAARTAREFLEMARGVAARGVTTLVPCLAPASADELAAALEAFRTAQAVPSPGARLGGVRVETPFRNPAVTNGPCLALDDPRAQAWLPILAQHADIIRLVTLAPELSGADELLQQLRAANIAVSLGHSAADYHDALDAIEAGATHVTRLFEEMSALTPLQPGLAGAALERDELFTEFRCDLTVLHPSLISIIISAKGAERALPAASDGDPLAAVRVLVNDVGWDLTEALAMVAATPALFLGGQNFGGIQVGAVADLAILDQELNPVATLVGGGTVWNRG